MKRIEKEAKTFEEALEFILNDNKLTENDVVYKKETVKGKLFKGETVKVTVFTKKDLYDYIKEYLKEICKGLNLDVSFEVKTKENRTTIKMFSENNPILIGKNGHTIKALETLVRQKMTADFDISFKVTLDVENYKDKREARLIRLGKDTAKEVLKTKNTIHLENMNSFERRIVHNTLNNFDNINTHSEGEEPNRHIVVEYKK